MPKLAASALARAASAQPGPTGRASRSGSGLGGVDGITESFGVADLLQRRGDLGLGDDQLLGEFLVQVALEAAATGSTAMAVRA